MTATYKAGDDAADAERARLAYLSDLFDGGTVARLQRLGVASGWSCLEVGAGSGSIARRLGEIVAPGRVLAVDVDLRFVDTRGADNVDVREHDIAAGGPLDGAFDLVHARGVLEHVSARDQALANMVAAAAPGGLVVVEDVDWLVFEHQNLPPAFARLHGALQDAYVASAGYDPYLGRRLQGWLTVAGLEDVECDGRVFTMVGGSPSMEWYILGIERALPTLVAVGIIEQAQADAALAEVRHPSCRLLSPLQVTAWGTKPPKA